MMSAGSELESRFSKTLSYDVDRHVAFCGCLPDSIADADQDSAIGCRTHCQIFLALVFDCRYVVASLSSDVRTIV